MVLSAHDSNRQVAAVLFEVSDLLKARGVRFKPQAYAKAAKTIEGLDRDIRDIEAEDKLEEIPGVGMHIANKVREIVKTGHLVYLDTLRQNLPEGISAIAEVEGIGPKRAEVLVKELGITSIPQLEAAAAAGKIRDLPGFGELSEKKILTILKGKSQPNARILLGEILPVAEEIVRQLAREPATKQVSLAGSIRRKKESIGDVDILASSGAPEKVMETFCTLPRVSRVIERGPTRSSVVLDSGLHVDLRVVDENQFGAALLYFTGSKDFNIALRRWALKRDEKLNEYGLFDRTTNAVRAGKDEQEMFQALGLPFIEPELRENRGEIEAAANGTLPEILPYRSIRGDLHVHTRWSDGKNSMEEMALAAKSRGYDYIAICDHAKSQQITFGLDEPAIRKQQSEIEKLNKSLDGITVLSGIECNIHQDGNLDVSKAVLQDRDIVLAGVHSYLDIEEQEMTNRLLSALHNDYLDVLTHPTSRIILQREPARFDLPAIANAAAGQKVALEVNGYPSRLDLPDTFCMLARGFKASFALGSDAHRKEDLSFMDLGIATARRGWLGPADVINSLPLKNLRTRLGS